MKDKLVVFFFKVKDGEHFGSCHSFKMLISVLYCIRIVHYILFHHLEVNTDADLTFKISDTDHGQSLGAVALLDKIILLYFREIFLDRDHDGR